MSRSVIFKTLWLASERDSKARVQHFQTSRTLLLGTNGTGKSRVTKSLFWTLGCAPPKLFLGGWDPDTIGCLHFSWKETDYCVIRQGKRIALFEGKDKLIVAAERMSVWDVEIAQFFGYHLQLKRSGRPGYGRAGPGFLTLPFYIDQDGSWGADWDTYTDMGQYTKWKSPTFESFIGLRPNGYFHAKNVMDQIQASVLEKQREIDGQRRAFKSVTEVLPPNLPSLNLTAFRRELAELGRKTIGLQKNQSSLRAKLLVAVNDRGRLQGEINLATAAQSELLEDLTYLSDQPVEGLECPTCGTIHQNSFHSRLQLSEDSEVMNALVAELRGNFEKVRTAEKVIRLELEAVAEDLEAIDRLMETKKAKMKLGDVIAAHGKRTLDTAFMKVSDTLGAELDILVRAKTIEQRKLKNYDDVERRKAVSAYYADQVQSLSIKLHIPSNERITSPKPESRSGSGGSSAPRSMLAVHLAALRANVEHGDSPWFPLVVDTPQQSGQDDSNLRGMIETLAKSAGDQHQVILAIEKAPDGVDLSAYEVVHFDTQLGALNQDAFPQVFQVLSPMMSTLRAHLSASDQ